MKAIPALALLAVLGVVVAGCGSGEKVGSISFISPTTTTVANVKPGELIRCGSFGAKVPHAGQGVSASADGPSESGTLDLKWQRDGSLLVSCTFFKKGA